VERTDIEFHDVTGDRVRIEVTVNNAGGQASRPTTMRIESAPLGAFVPWRPLTQLVVPALAPGESRKLSTEVRRPRPVPLGDFDRVPPRRLLTAVSSPDLPLRPNSHILKWLEMLRTGRSTPAQGEHPTAEVTLAPDLWDLLGQRQQYWAGNLNVFVDNRPVERHVAKELRVYAGRTNLAVFFVGDPRERDDFAFELMVSDPAWKAVLHDVTNGNSLVVGPQAARLEETQWVHSNEGLLVLLATQPPRDCSVGNVEVQVTRRSDQQNAIVEFNLNPAAQGPGCYYV
jgi:hypothetical protein